MTLNKFQSVKNPYLEMHKKQPIHWFPWCEEAFTKAKEENKPVFLSIGYSTCHWCHVMAKESFEDKEIAALLNKGFISIKVDREEHPEVDFVQLQINYLDWENDVIQSRKCYETAVRYGKPVVVMEPVKGGMLANLPKEAETLLRAHDAKASPASYALRFAASLENVMMVLSGMSNLEQVTENILVMDEVKSLTEEEEVLLKKVTEVVNESIDIPCTACGYCMEVCPKNIAIPGLFGLYNNYKITGGFSNMYYNRIVFDKGKASDCIGCQLCKKNCPQHIEIPEQLKKITEFEKR